MQGKKDRNSVAVAVFHRLAARYQQKFMDVSLYAGALNYFCDALPPAAPVLELACGPGNITRYLADRRPDLHITGTDLAPAMLALAQANNPGARFMLLDCRALSQLEQKYEGIVAGFVLPYLTRVETRALICAAAGRLLPGGVLYLSTMEDSYRCSGPRRSSAGDEIFMHYYEGRWLRAVLGREGFSLELEERKRYPGSDGTEVTDLLLVARLR